MRWFAIAVVAGLGLGCTSTPFSLLRSESGEEIFWNSDRFLLVVGFTWTGVSAEHAGRPEFYIDRCRKQIRRYVHDLNRVAGRELLTMQNDPNLVADVRVRTTLTTFGQTELRITDAEIRSALVRIPCRANDLNLARITAHELLHVVGFAHNTSGMAAVLASVRREDRYPDFLATDPRALIAPRKGSHPETGIVVVAHQTRARHRLPSLDSKLHRPLSIRTTTHARSSSSFPRRRTCRLSTCS